jgi:hypothetical protein
VNEPAVGIRRACAEGKLKLKISGKAIHMRALSKVVGSLACVAALVFAVSQVSAQNLIANGNFETGNLNGWQVFQNNPPLTDVTTINDNGPSAPGVWAADMHNLNQALGLTLKQTTAPGSVVGAGVIVNWSFDEKVVQSANGGVFFIEMFDVNAAGAVLDRPVFLGPYFNAQWQTLSGSWTTTNPNTDAVVVQFEAVTGAVQGSVEQVRVDNVVIVPEPSTLALAGLGLIALFGMQRRNA